MPTREEDKQQKQQKWGELLPPLAVLASLRAAVGRGLDSRRLQLFGPIDSERGFLPLPVVGVACRG